MGRRKADKVWTPSEAKRFGYAWFVGHSALRESEKWSLAALASEFVNRRFHRLRFMDLDTAPQPQIKEGEVTWEPYKITDEHGRTTVEGEQKQENRPPTPEEKARSEKLAENRRRVWEKKYLALAATFQKLWKRRLSRLDKSAVNEALDWIFSSRRLQSESPFKFRVGGSIFEPRDILDSIAFVIVDAHRRRLLRECEGRKRGYKCDRPLLVATEKRNKLCTFCLRESTLASRQRSIERQRKKTRP